MEINAEVIDPVGRKAHSRVFNPLLPMMNPMRKWKPTRMTTTLSKSVDATTILLVFTHSGWANVTKNVLIP